MAYFGLNCQQEAIFSFHLPLKEKFCLLLSILHEMYTENFCCRLKDGNRMVKIIESWNYYVDGCKYFLFIQWKPICRKKMSKINDSLIIEKSQYCVSTKSCYPQKRKVQWCYGHSHYIEWSHVNSNYVMDAILEQFQI